VARGALHAGRMRASFGGRNTLGTTL